MKIRVLFALPALATVLDLTASADSSIKLVPELNSEAIDFRVASERFTR